MTDENLFKLYYIAWQQKNKIRDYSEFKDLEFKLEYLKENIKKLNNISNIEQYFTHTMYLDVWVDICDKNINFFIEKCLIYINKFIPNIVDTLYYISSNDLQEYLHYDKEDFIPIFNDNNFVVSRKEISKNLKIKNLLLIIKKLDNNLYNSINYQIKAKLKTKINSIYCIKELWNTIGIEENGKVNFNNKSFKELEKLLISHPNLIKDYPDELNNYLSLLQYSKINNFEKIKKMLSL